MNKIFQIKYKAGGSIKYVYIMKETENIYSNYTDCVEQNNNKVSIVEHLKIKEALTEKKIIILNGK